MVFGRASPVPWESRVLKGKGTDESIVPKVLIWHQLLLLPDLDRGQQILVVYISGVWRRNQLPINGPSCLIHVNVQGGIDHSEDSVVFVTVYLQGY